MTNHNGTMVGLVFLAVAGVLACGRSGGGPAPDGGLAPEYGPFPSLQGTFKATLHVDAKAPAEGGNGSREHPFHTIGQALDAAPAGGAILVAPGEYRESLYVDKGPLAIVGSWVPGSQDEGTVLKPPFEAYGVAVAGMIGPGGPIPELVMLKGLRVIEPTMVGIWVDQGNVSIEACRIEGARAIQGKDENGDPIPVYGFGILATRGSNLTVRGSEIVRSDRTGILISGSSGTIEDNLVEENAGGGIRLERCTETRVTLRSNRVLGNQHMGIGVFSSTAAVLQNTVSDTKGDPALGGDGIVASQLVGDQGNLLDPVDIEVIANTVEKSARVGILYDSNTTGLIRGNSVSRNRTAGVWLQAGAGKGDPVPVESNVVSGNFKVGIGVTSGAAADICDNDVTLTEAGSSLEGGSLVEIAYGLGVFGGAFARVHDNRFGPFGNTGGASLADVLIDSAADGTEVKDNHPAPGTSSFKIVVQHQPETAQVIANEKDNPGAIVEYYGPGATSPYRTTKELTSGIANVNQKATGEMGPAGPGS